MLHYWKISLEAFWIPQTHTKGWFPKSGIRKSYVLPLACWMTPGKLFHPSASLPWKDFGGSPWQRLLLFAGAQLRPLYGRQSRDPSPGPRGTGVPVPARGARCSASRSGSVPVPVPVPLRSRCRSWAGTAPVPVPLRSWCRSGPGVTRCRCRRRALGGAALGRADLCWSQRSRRSRGSEGGNRKGCANPGALSASVLAARLISPSFPRGAACWVLKRPCGASVGIQQLLRLFFRGLITSNAWLGRGIPFCCREFCQTLNVELKFSMLWTIPHPEPFLLLKISAWEKGFWVYPNVIVLFLTCSL